MSNPFKGWLPAWEKALLTHITPTMWEVIESFEETERCFTRSELRNAVDGGTATREQILETTSELDAFFVYRSLGVWTGYAREHFEQAPLTTDAVILFYTIDEVRLVNGSTIYTCSQE